MPFLSLVSSDHNSIQDHPRSPDEASSRPLSNTWRAHRRADATIATPYPSCQLTNRGVEQCV